MTILKQKWWLFVVLAVLAAGAVAGWAWLQRRDAHPGFVTGNGRIEATEIDLAAKAPGRLTDVTVSEGAFVKAGQVLARMQVSSLDAQRQEIQAQRQQALTAVASAQAGVTVRESDVLAAQAVVAQRESELDAAQRRLARSQTLSAEGAASAQETDDDRSRVRSVQAALAAARAQVAAAQAAVEAARAQVVGAQAQVRALDATLARVSVEIDDTVLKAPRDGRVQYLVTQPGEVLGAGGKVLNLIDVSDVYMSFFLPETVAGRVALGQEVRIVLDAAPQYVIPARVSFVATVAQFTPKTVETASERQKLMFRVKAQIPPELLRQHAEQVKTGLPGVAWIRLDAHAPWPAALERTPATRAGS